MIMNENRNERLERDYHEMMKIQNRPYLSWIPTKGELPFAEEYLLFVRLRSYVLTARDGKYLVGTTDRCTVKVTLWDSYPYIAPNIRMLDLPPVFHPDWYSKGTYCPREAWRPDMPLKDFLLQMLETLRFEPSALHTAAPANYKALEWWMKNRENTSLFPSDPTPLTENTVQEAAAIEKTALSFGEVIDSWAVR